MPAFTQNNLENLIQNCMNTPLSVYKLKSKVDLIAETIIKMIQEGHLKKEEALPPEMELAKLLGVGRSSIREAVKLLVSQNILEIKRGLGTFVAKNPGVLPDPFGFRFYKDKLQLGYDLCEVRLLIEPKLAEKAAEIATKEQIEKICEAHEKIKYLVDIGENHSSVDIAFHSSIAACFPNCVLPSIMDIIYASIDYVINLNDRTLCKEAIDTHDMIVKAILNKNGKAASEAMKLHIAQIQNDIKLRQRMRINQE